MPGELDEHHDLMYMSINFAVRTAGCSEKNASSQRSNKTWCVITRVSIGVVIVVDYFG